MFSNAIGKEMDQLGRSLEPPGMFGLSWTPSASSNVAVRIAEGASERSRWVRGMTSFGGAENGNPVHFDSRALIS